MQEHVMEDGWFDDACTEILLVMDVPPKLDASISSPSYEDFARVRSELASHSGGVGRVAFGPFITWFEDHYRRGEYKCREWK